MKQRWYLLALCLLLIPFAPAYGQYGTLTFRADVTGAGTWNDHGTIKIQPNAALDVNIYSNYAGGTKPRITWSSPFLFNGSGGVTTVTWGALTNTPQAQFVAFWDLFKTTYTESWDGNLTNDIGNGNLGDLFNYTGVGFMGGYPAGLGDVKILVFPVTVNATSGSFCIQQGDAANETYDWVFDESEPPFPFFPTTCWTVQDSAAPVNQPPVVSGIPDQTISEGGTFAAINLDNYVTDPDNADNQITWTYSGNTQLTVSIVSRVATITTPNADWNGGETITFRATDPGTLFASDAATFTVTAVNDAPVVSGIPDQTIAEGGAFATINLDNYVADPDNADDQITWTYSGKTGLIVSIVNRVATITVPGPEWNGSDTITFTARDPGGLTGSDVATFTVTAVNDPPVVSGIPDQTISRGGAFTPIVLDNYVTDPDNTKPELTWSYNGNTVLNVSIVNRIATITTSDPLWGGSETITFTATDPGALSDSDAAIFTIVAVNRPPILDKIATGPQFVDEGSILMLYAHATDSDGTVPSLYTSDLPPNAIFVDSGNGYGWFRFAPDTTQAGDYPVWFYASDGQLKDSELVLIIVNNVVIDNPCLAVEPDNLFFSFNRCDTMPIRDTQYIHISNCGIGQLNWVIDSTPPNWLWVEPISGVAGDSIGVWLNYMVDSLRPNAGDSIVLQGSFTIVAPGAVNSPKIIDVTAIIKCQPSETTLVALPPNYVFHILRGDSLPDTALYIFETHGMNIPFWTYNFQPWLYPDTPSVLPLITPKAVPLKFQTNLLHLGTNADSLMICYGIGKCINVPIVIYVDSGCTSRDLVTIPQSFSFTLQQGQVDNGGLYVYERMGCIVPFTAENFENWLKIIPRDSGFYATPSNVYFEVDARSLLPGFYGDTILLRDYTGEYMPLLKGIPVYLTVLEQQPSSDSLWISSVPAVPGSEIVVPIYFKNDEMLSSINLPLKWSSSAVQLDSISFGGTRVDYVDVKAVAFDNVMRQAHILIIPSFTPEIPIGRGMLAKLHFTVPDSTPPGFVMIDTVISMTLGSLQFVDDAHNVIVPTFIPGHVIIGDTPGYICGRVVDTAGNEIPGATVELWDNFPGGAVMVSQMSDINGQFACHSSGVFPFDAYAYKEGYYPGLLSDIPFGMTGFDIVLTPVSPVKPTPEWVDFYCATNFYYGVPLPAGSVVDAYDPQGIHCGTFYVTTPGSYGLMPVYRDDPFTIEDEGAVPGDTIEFFINGYPATAIGDRIWTAKGDNFQVCLDVFTVEDRMIVLKEGWNLISWNVDTPIDSIQKILSSVADCIDVVLGFEQGGFTYDPKLPQFSTLWETDHFHGYWLRMNCGDTLKVTGVPVAATTPIALEGGWNLVSYMPEVADSTPMALSSILDNLIVALGFEGVGLTYDPKLPDYSTLLMMRPGFGYWVKVNTDDMLIYPGMGPEIIFPQGLAKLDRAAGNNRVMPSRIWMDLYSYQMKLDDKVVATGAEVTAVGVDGRVIGAGTVAADGKFGFVPVYGDDPATTEREGLAKGEKFSLVVDGVPTGETFTWSDMGDRLEIKSLTSKSGSTVIPTDFGLLQNYPNPFNPATTISFTVPTATHATLEIYNVLGKKVATVFEGMAQSGLNEVVWDGRNENGDAVASGIYFYRLKAAAFEQTRKMVLMK
ncbi:MAG: Ig-like domain-containing protein [candidate division Zixibacteria bacterium]|nr:Ig-like domain-containing protein [candidate division Zixibacteria bacterium]